MKAGFKKSILLLGLWAGFTQVAQAIVPTPPEIFAKAYLVMDANTGVVLSERGADDRLDPASLTKMLTSYVADYELAKGRIHLSDMTTVSERAWAKNFPGSSLMFLQVGTQVSVEDLLKGVVISSGNDATIALAEHIAGSADAFADLMNQHAQKIGMKHSHFMNPHGLSDPNHYTTARDMAILAQAIIRDFPDRYKVYAQKSYVYNNITQQNRNTLLWTDPSVDGLKTGHTDIAGYCLVASAKRGDMRLITVVLGTDSTKARAVETQKILAYGFRNFKTLKLYSKNQVVTKAHLWGGETADVSLVAKADVYATLPAAQASAVSTKMKVNQYIQAPLKAGTQLGTIEVTLPDGKVLSSALVVKDDVVKGGFFVRIWDAIHLFFFKMMQG